MQNKFKNPALELMEKQEKILRAFNNPALEMQNYTSKFLAGINTNRIYEIERIAQKMCPPQPLMDALDTYNRTISITTDRDFMGINKFAETLQKQLAAVREPMFQLAEINFSDWNSPVMNDITSMAASMNTALDPLIKSLSVYNTPAFRDSLFSSAMAINSALIDSFGYLHDIAIDFPNEAEQVLSEHPLDMFSEELIFEKEKGTFIRKVKEFLSPLTPFQKISVLFMLLNFLMNVLIATNPSISASYFITNISDISAFNLSNIVFSDNIVQDAERLGGTKEDVIGATAVTIHPNQTVNEMHILVDLNIINENYYELTRVLIHEFIHVYDFLQLGKLYFNNDMSNLEEYPYWDIFKLSSEFIAYSHADIYAQKFSEIINGTRIYELMSENYKENFPNYFKNICNQMHLDSIEKISTSKKVGGAMLFGLFSSDVRNTMYCKNCGHKW